MAPMGDKADVLELEATPVNQQESDNMSDPGLDRRVLWKLDLFILPVLSSVYFFAAMGRSDLANAKVSGMDTDLSLSAADYSNAATTLLVGYILFQLPGTLLVRQVGPNRQFAVAMILWGLFTVVTVCIHTSGALLGLRFMVGASEAFVQGAIFYLSFWYQYKELATRGAIFYSMSTLAGAFNGMVSYGIVKNFDGAQGWRAWKWIFLIEGILPMVFSLVVLFLLPASPFKIRFGFTEAEKECIKTRSMAAHNVSEYKMQWHKVPLVLLNPHFWMFTGIACGGHFCAGSLSNFLPAIIHSFGYTSLNAQLFSVIVYASAATGVIFWARVADKTNARGLTLAASTVGAIVGYSLLIGIENKDVQFFATCLVAFSIYPNIVLQLTWATMCFTGYTRRGSSLAFFNIFSQCVAIAGTQAYSDPPYYRNGHVSSLVLSCFVFGCTVFLRFYLQYMNKQKQKLSPEKAAELRAKDMEEIGDLHPDFVYTI